MDSSKISRLEEEQIKAFQGTLSEIQQWETFKKDYETLEDRLKTLPDKVTHQVMVPFGPMAFMPGQLIHTNEITVLLGDNWFVERSARQACGIVQRRIEHVQGMIKDLQKQKELLEARLGFTADFKAESAKAEGLVDIREEYDAEKEAQWREERRKKRTTATSQTARRNIADHQPSTAATKVTPVEEKKLMEKKEQEQVSESVKEKTGKQKRMEEMEAALFARLDALEKQEEEFDELAMMSDFDENEDESDEDDIDSDDEDDTPACGTKNKRVQWMDTSPMDKTQQPATITFQHSITSKTKNSETSDAGVIQSPRDLYNLVQTSPDKEESPVAVKSILKKQSSYGKLETKKVVEEDTAPKQPLPTPTSVFTGSVVERKPLESPPRLPHESAYQHPATQGSANQGSANPASQRVSKFKAARQGKR